MKKNHSIKTYTVIAVLFVVSLVVLAVSVSYSFFNIRVSGEVQKKTPDGAGDFLVTSTLNDSDIINAAELALIDGTNYLTEAESVSFSVTNSVDSDVNAKYTIDIDEMSLSKNLASKYFKWVIIVNGEEKARGDFADETIAPEGTSDTTLVENLTKHLITEENALSLNIGATDNLVFYMWLENDEAVDQLYLTNGTFKGKLSMSAVPSKN